MHVLGADDHARTALERAVCGERHPVSVKIVRRRDWCAGVLNVQGIFLPATEARFVAGNVSVSKARRNASLMPVDAK